jgi:hypothetical protein
MNIYNLLYQEQSEQSENCHCKDAALHNVFSQQAAHIL